MRRDWCEIVLPEDGWSQTTSNNPVQPAHTIIVSSVQERAQRSHRGPSPAWRTGVYADEQKPERYSLLRRYRRFSEVSPVCLP